MKPQNYKQIRVRKIYFWLSFAILVLFALLPVVSFIKSYDAQKEIILADINDYKEILNKQLVLHQKVDSLYDQMLLLNTARVGNSLALERHIADNKNTVLMLIGKDSNEFAHYCILMKNIDNILMLKDSIRMIDNHEKIAYRDMMECIDKSHKIKRDLSYDPARRFSAVH